MPELIKTILIGLSVAVGISSYYWWPFHPKEDNPVEQVSENILHELTGVDIDFTPSKSRTILQLKSTSTEHDE